MTSSGIYQIIERRAEQAGMKINPHKFRHTFSHNWLNGKNCICCIIRQVA